MTHLLVIEGPRGSLQKSPRSRKACSCSTYINDCKPIFVEPTSEEILDLLVGMKNCATNIWLTEKKGAVVALLSLPSWLKSL